MGKPHIISLEDFKDYTSNVLLAKGDGKIMQWRVQVVGGIMHTELQVIGVGSMPYAFTEQDFDQAIDKYNSL